MIVGNKRQVVHLVTGLLVCSHWMPVSWSLSKNETSVKNELMRYMEQLMTEHFKPIHVEVIKQPFNASLDKEIEQCPYRLVVVSDKFNNVPVLRCHMLVQEVLIKAGVYKMTKTVQICTKTPKFWEEEKFLDELERQSYL